MNVRSYRDEDRAALVALWRETLPAGAPHHDPDRSLDLKLAVDRELLLVAVTDDGELAGAVMGGWDGHRGWVYSLAVSPNRRRRGVGTALMRELETRLAALGCPKVNLQVLPDNAAVTAFYERLGYAVEPRISMGKRLYD